MKRLLVIAWISVLSCLARSAEATVSTEYLNSPSDTDLEEESAAPKNVVVVFAGDGTSTCASPKIFSGGGTSTCAAALQVHDEQNNAENQKLMQIQFLMHQAQTEVERKMVLERALAIINSDHQ